MLRAIRPFLLVLTPLVVGLGVYWFFWRGEADHFAERLEAVTGQRPAISGFPYRLAADLPPLELTAGGEALSARLATDAGELTRGPFRGSLFVGRVTDARLDVGSEGLGLGDLVVEATVADLSLRMDGERIARLSVVSDMARLTAPLFGGEASAEDLQLHFRETPDPGAISAPTGPGQADVRLSALLAWPDGRRAAVVLPIRITDDAPLASVRAWRSGGTLELEGGAILGAEGEPVATFDATAAAVEGSLAVSGTLETDCPLTVRALFGEVIESEEAEYRRRRPAKFVLGGTVDAPTLSERPTPSGGLARNREPPCPALHR